MIMMGPKKDKGGMVTLIIEKMKDHYKNGKESNEEFGEKPEHEEEHEVYEHYKEEVDGMLDAIKRCVKGEGDEESYKEEFSKCLKMFIKKCVKE